MHTAELATADQNLLLQIRTCYCRSELATADQNLLLQIRTCYCRSELATADHARSELATADHARSELVTANHARLMQDQNLLHCVTARYWNSPSWPEFVLL